MCLCVFQKGLVDIVPNYDALEKKLANEIREQYSSHGVIVDNIHECVKLKLSVEGEI